MLVALNTSSNRVVATDAVRSERYVCPACGESVVLKKGTRVVHHFAHRPHSDCGFAGETMRHLEMKLRAFEGFERMQPDLERVMCGGARRADVSVVVNGRQIAIECQQSSITIEELKQRITDYQGRVIWIVDAPRFFGNDGVRVGNIRPRRKTPLALRYLIAMYGGLYVLEGAQLLFVQVSRRDWDDCSFFGCRTISDLWVDHISGIATPWSVGWRGNRAPVPVSLQQVPDDEGWL